MIQDFPTPFPVDRATESVLENRIPAGDGRLRLLIVDDEPTVRDVVQRLAEVNGFDTTLVENGREAMQQIEQTTFDAIVTDIFMPDQDGLELLRQLRGRKQAPIIIAMSGGGRFGFSALGTATLLGATHVLSKPFDVSRFIELLQGVSVQARNRIQPLETQR